jgi:hypothetical protein
VRDSLEAIGGNMTNYIYLLYGQQDDCYLEAAYGIGTLLKRIDAQTSRVIVFTDREEKIKKWPVICESIAPDLVAMQGPTRFIHRTKLCVILRCLDKYSGNLIYLDSDTFVAGDINLLANQLNPGTTIMDSFESKNPLPELTGFQTLLAGKIHYAYTKNSVMNNAGVIGLHRSDRRLAEEALALCDALLATGNRRHTIEQFSISETMRLADTKIIKSHGVIIHYVKAKLYVREQVLKWIHKTGRQPWEFERAIPYWYPAIKFMKLFGKYTS